MTEISPGSRAEQVPSRTRLRAVARQLAWASVPVWSVTLLAPAPFLVRAIIRRRAGDWVVFGAYLGIVAGGLALLTADKAGSGLSVTGGLLLALVWVVAPVHAFVAFRPGAGPWSWKEARAVREAGNMASDSENLAAAAALPGRQHGGPPGPAGAAPPPAGPDVGARGKRQMKAERRTARAAAKADRAAQKTASRAAAEAARLAAPRYGWVETRRTYRRKTILGNRRSETVVSLQSQRNARRRTRQRGGVTITEEWRRLD